MGGCRAVDLTDLIALYRGPLIGLLASWGVPWREASELAEDSFAVAWLNREACRGDWADPPTFGRWLRGVARNRHRNWARARGRWRRRFVPLDPGQVGDLAVAPDPADAAEPSEAIASLRRAIDRLPAPQRQVILMHYLEETSVREVATLLAITPKAVEGRLFQARRRLRELLAGSAPRTLTLGRCLLW